MTQKGKKSFYAWIIKFLCICICINTLRALILFFVWFSFLMREWMGVMNKSKCSPCWGSCGRVLPLQETRYGQPQASKTRLEPVLLGSTCQQRRQLQLTGMRRGCQGSKNVFQPLYWGQMVMEALCLLFDESKRSAPSSPSFHKACSLCATGAEKSQYLPSSDVLKIPGPVRSSNLWQNKTRP